MALICSPRLKAIVASANAPRTAMPIQITTRKIFGMEPEILWPIQRWSAIANRLLRAYPGGEIYFRAAACTGALYELDLYVVTGDLPGSDAGVYHFNPADVWLRL